MDNHTFSGGLPPSGRTTMRVRRDLGDLRIQKPSLVWRLKHLVGIHRGTPAHVAALLVGRIFGVVSVRAKLSAQLYRPNWSALSIEQAARLKALLAENVDVRELTRYFGGAVTNYGLLSTRVVTDLGVGFIVDAFQNLVELENMKWHGFGTGGTAEGQTQTALVTELTTQYVGDARPVGTTVEGASANIYRTVATLSPDSGGTIAVTEHGVFSAVSAGVMLDRSLFSVVNVVASQDSLQATYELTVSAGG